MEVIKDWENKCRCLYAERMWVSNKTINEINTKYEKGKKQFLRVFCWHKGDWCDFVGDDSKQCPEIPDELYNNDK